MAELKDLLNKTKTFKRKKKLRPWTVSDGKQNPSTISADVSNPVSDAPNRPVVDSSLSPTTNTHNFEIEHLNRSNKVRTQSTDTKYGHKLNKERTQSTDTKSEHKSKIERTQSTDTKIDFKERSEHKERTQKNVQNNAFNSFAQPESKEVPRQKERTQSTDTNYNLQNNINKLTNSTESKNIGEFSQFSLDKLNFAKEKSSTEIGKSEHKVRTQNLGKTVGLLKKNEHKERTHFLKNISNKESKSEHKVRTQITPNANTSKKGYLTAQSADTKSEHRANTVRTHIKTQSTDTQCEHSTNTNSNPITLKKGLLQLGGNKFKIFNTIAKFCIDQKARHIIITHDALAEFSQVSTGSVKTTTQRMKKEGYLIKIPHGRGNGCPIYFEIPEPYFQEYLQLRIGESTNTKYEHRANTNLPKYEHRANTGTDTIPSSKLDSNLNISNYTSEPQIIEDPYKDVDISSLAKFGISRKQLRDIQNQKLNITGFQVQEFIERFSQFISSPESRGVRSPAGLFVKMLQEVSQGLEPLPHLESESDKDLKDLKQKLLLRKEQREKEILDIQELVFDDWYSSATKGEKGKLVPSNYVKDHNIYKNAVFQKWKDDIWPTTEEYKKIK